MCKPQDNKKKTKFERLYRLMDDDLKIFSSAKDFGVTFSKA